jgi:hypothetical protein
MSMRLTLRTLLAYLDDTLDPAEIRTIGQKVKESDAAQELVARIRQVTRRRRLTAPPATGPGAKLDPNTIAEYLDNVLPSEQVAEVEKTCLDSDVHLAEIAACHQILTLVLGEPALVPPTARQRMYGLVRGREAIPYRRAPAAARTGEGGEGAENEADDTLLLGLPFYRRRGGLFAVLMPAAAVLLVVLLGAALWFAVPSSSGPPRVAQVPGRELPVSNPDAKKIDDKKPDDKKPDDKKPADQGPGPNDKKPDEPKKPDDVVAPPANPRPEPPPPPQDLLKERREAAQIILVKDRPNMLLQRHEQAAADKDTWVRLGPEKTVSTGDLLVSLPGFRTTLRCKNGLDLTLWGNVPEAYLPMPILESAVVLNNNPGVGLDFTLDRGRVLVTSQSGDATRLRVRFGGSPPSPPEVWDVILETPGTEVIMDLVGRAVADAGAGFRSGLPPQTEFSLLVLKGQATVKRQGKTWGVPPEWGPTMFFWINRVGQVSVGPPPKEYLAFFRKELPETPAAKEMNAALDTLLPGPGAAKPIEEVLDARLQAPTATAAQRTLAVYCLGALDLLPKLLDCIDAQDRNDVRKTAVLALIPWLGRRAGQDEKLFEVLVNQKGYKESQATTVLQLLYGFTDQQLKDPDIWDTLISSLKSQRPAIRELAYYHLIRRVPQARTARDPAQYDPGNDPDKAYIAWKALIPDGKLPPLPMGGGPR